MRQNRVHGPAPSMRAASSSSSGTDCRPASMMMKDSPRNCQIVISATAGRAHVVLSRAGGFGLMPSQGSSPTTGLSSVPNTTEATATGTDHRGGEDHPVGGHALELAVRRHGQRQARPAG